MASSFHASAATSLAQRAAAYPAAHAAASVPPGTFSPGTKVQVGHHRVVIEKYLSEGGFAHVYVVRVPQGHKTETAVLKRVAVPDKESLASMRTEVETMKRLKGHRHIVTYIDSHASQLKGGGYEVFLLMEHCAGGGLIDFMNTRLQHRLTEPEILKIFSDVAEGVACMHYLKPPLLHRDLKVENVLISTSGSSRMYKLCDFGSTAPPRPAATSAAEGRLIEDDVQRHTTLQYRSPEMIDVYRKQPIDEKSDIWALGVLLYKLCYYTTPFEEQGQMAILNASFKYPHYPPFGHRTKSLIASMLRENPQERPNIYQVIRDVCSMRNTEIPIKDIYANRTPSEARKNAQLPSPSSVSSPPVVGISKATPAEQAPTIPEITPMRRGRPTAPVQSPPAAKPSPSPLRHGGNDPFAALDSSSAPARAAAADELAARFPSLDEFSLMHDRGAKFQFDPASPADAALNKRVTEALADEVFAQASPARTDARPSSATSPEISRAPAVPSTQRGDSLPQSKRQSQDLRQPGAERPVMVSQGTMTSPAPSPPLSAYTESKSRPLYRFSDPRRHQHSPSLPPSAAARTSAPTLHPEPPLSARPSLLAAHRSRSQSSGLAIPRSPASSRPSLEGSRPSAADLGGDDLGRSRSANASARPSSLHMESHLDYLRSREGGAHSRTASSSSPRPGDPPPPRLSPRPTFSVDAPTDEPGSYAADERDRTNISNMAFLRAMEDGGGPDSGGSKRRRRRSSGTTHAAGAAEGKPKRSSMPSISLSGTRNILAGKFGDAFRRFEGATHAHAQPSPTSPPAEDPDAPTAALTGRRSPSPLLLDAQQRGRGGRGAGLALAPIAGSEKADTRSSFDSDRDDVDDDDDKVNGPGPRDGDDSGDAGRDAPLDESQALSPETRRERERRRLSQEERRVAAAGREYRRRFESGGGGSGGGGGGRGVVASIQSRVESFAAPPDPRQHHHQPPQRTAEGYGRFTAASTNPPRATSPAKPAPSSSTAAAAAALAHRKAKPLPPAPTLDTTAPTSTTRSASSPAREAAATGRPRPNVAPKPRALRTGGATEMSSSSPDAATAGPGGAVLPRKSATVAAPAGVAGRRAPHGGRRPGADAGGSAGGGEDEDWEASFSRRYPSLSGLEMVEAEIGRVATKEV